MNGAARGRDAGAGMRREEAREASDEARQRVEEELVDDGAGRDDAREVEYARRTRPRTEASRVDRTRIRSWRRGRWPRFDRRCRRTNTR